MANPQADTGFIWKIESITLQLSELRPVNQYINMYMFILPSCVDYVVEF